MPVWIENKEVWNGNMRANASLKSKTEEVWNGKGGGGIECL